MRPLPAAPLRAVERQGRALDVAAARHGDDHVLFDDQVLDVDVGGLGDDLRAALVAELLLDLRELADDDVEHELLGAEDLLQLRDQGQDFLELRDDLLALEPRQPLEAHVQDRLRLDVVQAQHVLVLAPSRARPTAPCPTNFSRPGARHRDLGHQALLGLLGVLGGADDLDDQVDVRQRQREAAQQVRPLLRLLQVELRAPDDDRLAVVDEVPQQVVQRQDARLVVDDREEDDPEGRLHRRQRVELVQDDLRVLAALQLDDHPDAVAVRLVAQVRDPLELLLVDELGDPLDQLGLVDLVGDLRDDDRLLVAAGRLLDRAPWPAPARCRGRSCRRRGSPAAPWMKPAVGKSGPGSFFISCAERGVGVRISSIVASTTSPRLWGGMLVAMPDGDAGGAVDEEVRELAPGGPSARRASRRSWGSSRPSPCRCRRRSSPSARRVSRTSV